MLQRFRCNVAGLDALEGEKVPECAPPIPVCLDFEFACHIFEFLHASHAAPARVG